MDISNLDDFRIEAVNVSYTFPILSLSHVGHLLFYFWFLRHVEILLLPCPIWNQLSSSLSFLPCFWTCKCRLRLFYFGLLLSISLTHSHLSEICQFPFRCLCCLLSMDPWKTWVVRCVLLSSRLRFEAQLMYIHLTTLSLTDIVTLTHAILTLLSIHFDHGSFLSLFHVLLLSGCCSCAQFPRDDLSRLPCKGVRDRQRGCEMFKHVRNHITATFDDLSPFFASVWISRNKNQQWVSFPSVKSVVVCWHLHKNSYHSHLDTMGILHTVSINKSVQQSQLWRKQEKVGVTWLSKCLCVCRHNVYTRRIYVCWCCCISVLHCNVRISHSQNVPKVHITASFDELSYLPNIRLHPQSQPRFDSILFLIPPSHSVH